MNTRRSTARPLSVCTLLAMGAISLAACGNQSGNDVDNSSQAQSSTSAAASSSETTSKKKEADLSVDQSMGWGRCGVAVPGRLFWMENWSVRSTWRHAVDQ